MKRLALMLTFAMAVLPAASQTPARKPKFEAVSIKPNPVVPKIGEPNGRLSLDPSNGRFLAMRTPVRLLLRYAFDNHLPEDEMLRAGVLFNDSSGIQVIGGPGWINSEHFDVEARTTQDHKTSQPEMQLMVQSLLEDRFQLKSHKESHEVAIFNIVVVKPGKLKLSSDNAPAAQGLPPSPPGRLTVFGGAPTPAGSRATMYGKAITIATLIPILENWAGRRITNKTNFTGLFDVFLQFSPGNLSSVSSTEQGVLIPASDPSGPSIFTALQEQLGLKLESAKGPVEVLVIDSVQKPSEN